MTIKVKNKENISWGWIIFLSVLLLLIVMTTSYIGGNDSTEYSGVTKFFANQYKADIRSSHSLIFGALHSPLFYLFKSLLVLKISSVIILIAIAFSIYYISGRDKRPLLLFLLSPVVWYMGPWINPIQLSGLLFIWGFYFFTKFEEKRLSRFLLFSGILIGLAAIVWNTVFFLTVIFIICFFYNISVRNLSLFVLGFILGLVPLFAADFYWYSFPFYSILKFLFAVAGTSLYGGIYAGERVVQNTFLMYIAFLLMLPIFGYVFFKKEIFKKYPREIAFIVIALLFFLTNPQIRYLIFLWPIIIIVLTRNLDKKKFLIQACIFAILSLLVINPYLLQIKYGTNSPEFTSLLTNVGKWNISEERFESLIKADLKDLEKDYPNQSFVVGNKADDYAILAVIYSGKDIKEFVSIQDYSLFEENKTALFEKKLTFEPNIRDRRRMWIGGGLEKADDPTDYAALEYGIGVGSPLNLTGFSPVKTYRVLHISQKT